MIGFDLTDHDTAEAVEQACFERGLLVLTCGQRSVRMAPPLVVNAAQADTALAILADACEAVAAGRGEELHHDALPSHDQLADRAAALLAACGGSDSDGDQSARTPITGGSLGAAGAAGDVDAAVERAPPPSPTGATHRPRSRQRDPPLRRAAARAQGRARRAGVDRGRQDPLRGSRRGPGDDRHLRLRGRSLASAARADDRLRTPGPPA